MLTILAIVLGLLFAADFATTVYALHRWPAHVFENAGVMKSLVKDASPTVRDAILLATCAASIAVLYLLAPYLQGPVAYVVYLLGIVYQASTVYSNVVVIRDLS